MIFLRSLVASSVLGVAVLCTPCLAGVIVVDAGGGGAFVSLQAAVNAASDGDTIIVLPGTYLETLPVLIDNKSLVIAARKDPSASKNELFAGLIIVNLAPQRTVIVEGLSIFGLDGSSPATPAVELQNNQGKVRIQGTTSSKPFVVLEGGDAMNGDWLAHGATGVVVRNCASVALVNVVCLGGSGKMPDPNQISFSGDGGDGLVMFESHVTIYGGSCRGMNGMWGGNPFPSGGGGGGSGLVNTSGTLIVAGTFLSGADGGDACGTGGDGGDGLRLTTTDSSAILTTGTVTHGGSGGFAFKEGSDGQKVAAPPGTVTELQGVYRNFDVTTPVSEGATGKLSFNGLPIETVMLFASLHLGDTPFIQYTGVLLLAPPLIGPFVFGPPGKLNVPFVVPELGPGVEVVHVGLQVFYLNPNGSVLGPSYVLTMVDSAF